MPSTVLIWASWEVIWALSIGLSGSWFFSCSVSSLRKLLWASVVFEVAAAVFFCSLAMTSDEVAELTVLMMWVSG